MIKTIYIGKKKDLLDKIMLFIIRQLLKLIRLNFLDNI